MLVIFLIKCTLRELYNHFQTWLCNNRWRSIDYCSQFYNNHRFLRLKLPHIYFAVSRIDFIFPPSIYYYSIYYYFYITFLLQLVFDSRNNVYAKLHIAAFFIIICLSSVDFNNILRLLRSSQRSLIFREFAIFFGDACRSLMSINSNDFNIFTVINTSKIK